MKVSLFGGLQILDRNGIPVRFAARKSALVLAFLALSGSRGLKRDHLCSLLWEDREEKQARASLRQALVEIRRHLTREDPDEAQLAGDSDHMVFSLPPGSIDTLYFQDLLTLDQDQGLEAPAKIYRGELLAGVELPQAAADWIAPFRQEFTTKALRLVDVLSVKGNTPSSITICEDLARRLLHEDPAAEEAHRALIRLFLRQGQTSAAARQLRACIEALDRALGVKPERQTLALVEPAPKDHTTPTTDAESLRQRADNRPSVVVMPFDSLSGSADALLAEGFVEEITAMLSRIRDFFVIARPSAVAGNEAFADVQLLGQKLGVRYVVQGSLRRMESTIRITVRLVEAESRALIWTERYEGLVSDLFSLQDRIAAQVAGAMHPAILTAEIEAARRKPPHSMKAYELVLQAQLKMWKRIEEENREALVLLERAIALDDKYGRAHALLAWCHSQNIVYLWSPDAEAERAVIRAHIQTAAPLIGDDPLALTALGAALSQSLEAHARALRYVEAALALDPNSAWAWARVGWIRIFSEEYEVAKSCFETAIRLSPLDPLIFNFKFGIAACIGHMERFEEATQMLRETLDLYPDSAWGHRMLSAFAALAGDLETARASMEVLRQAQPRVSVALMRTHHPSRNIPRIFNRLLKGWRLAGLPED